MNSKYYSAEVNIRQRRSHILAVYKSAIATLKENRSLLVCYLIAIVILLGCAIAYALQPAPSESIVDSLTHPVYVLAVCLVSIGLSLSLLYIIGRPWYIGRISRAFIQAGVVNHADEPPLLTEIRRTKFRGCNDCEELVFDARGVPITLIEDNKGALQTTINKYILAIQDGSRPKIYRMILAPDVNGIPAFLTWDKTYLSVPHNTLTLGVTYGNMPYLVDLDKTPHILVAGQTGSGKSSALRVLIYSAIKKGDKVYVLDPKSGTDYPTYIRQHSTFVTTIDEFVTVLQAVETEMDIRYRILGCTDGAQNMTMYDAITGSHTPRIWVFVDEMAQITGIRGSKPDIKKKHEAAIASLVRLAQLSRASSISLVVSTQRPDMDVIPGLLKSNINLKMASLCDFNLSTVIFGDRRASDQIHTKGRFITDDEYQSVFQMPYITDNDMI